VLTSGGDAGGMNSAVPLIRRFKTADVGGIRQRRGTVIGTARSEAFSTREGRRRAADRPKAAGVGAHRALRSEDRQACLDPLQRRRKSRATSAGRGRSPGISLPISVMTADMGSPIANRYRRPLPIALSFIAFRQFELVSVHLPRERQIESKIPSLQQ
jgi:hypothetical protein